MRSMKKYRFLTGAAVVMLAAGCASASDVGSDESEQVKVTIWHYWDGANADTFDAMVKEFNGSQEDIVVGTSNVPNAEFLTKLRASATSDTLPDIAIGDLVWVPQVNQLGTLSDLSSAIDADTLSDIIPALTSYGSIDGKQVSVPVSANNLGYIYNKDLYRDAGLDPDTPPATWEEVLEQGRQVVAETGKPAYELFTQAGDNGEGLTWQFQVNLWQAGGEFLNADNTAAAFNAPAGEKALQYWVDLISDGVAVPVGPWGEFGKGEAAAATDGSWMVGIWAPDPPFDFGTATVPVPSDGTAVTNLGGEQAMVFDNSPTTAAAAGEFLNWFLEAEQVSEWSQATGMLPVTSAAATSSDYLGWVDSEQPLLRPFVDQMAHAKARPNTPLYPAVSFAFAKEIEKALAGSVSVNEALDNAENAVNKALEEG